MGANEKNKPVKDLAKGIIPSKNNTDRQLFPLIIVGAGPAGMTSALYAVRKGIKTLVLSKDIGGQVNWTSLVENYMGFAEIHGPELMKRFEEQMQGDLLTYRQEEIISITPRDNIFLVENKAGNIYQSQAVIIATGKRPRKLGVPGEDKFLGKGVAYCSTCDAPLFRGAPVAVIGGGNSGVEAVIDLLAVNAEVVHLITNLELSADEILVARIKNDPRVKIYPYHDVLAIKGERMVEAISIKNNKNTQETTIAVEGVFIEIGLDPNTEFLSGLAMNQYKELIVDCQCRTNIAGIFAAGDVTHIPEKQIIVAAGEGAKAAIQAGEYLQRLVTGAGR